MFLSPVSFVIWFGRKTIVRSLEEKSKQKLYAFPSQIVSLPVLPRQRQNIAGI